jgi:endonuclease/exonuclease/phosphatase family metal-dependent hydrolase
MTTISKENKLCYLMGDFNLDLMKYHCHHFTSEFLDIMYSNMFFPLITRPTRITSNTATLIDNIFSNHLENFSFSGLLFTDISDHLPIFCIVHDVLPNVDDDTPIVVREKNANNLFKFQEQLTHSHLVEK